MPATRTLHAATWLAWAVAAALSVQLAPSPAYVALVIALCALVVELEGGHGPFARAFPVLVGLALVFAGLRVALTAATTHGTGGAVLLTTPDVTLPRLLGGFTVGGTVEVAVVLQAASEAWAVVGVIAVFAAFNAVVSHYELVHGAPRAFYELGLVVTVALAFVPSTLEAIHDAREADRARTGGRVVRRGRLIRLVVPILERGLERAVALAESMDSRGFAHRGAGATERTAGWCGLAALVALGGAFVALVGRARPAAIALGLVGAVLLVVAVRFASAAAGRIRYRPRRLTSIDRAIIATVLVAPLALGGLALAGNSTLVWAVSPLRWPAFGLSPALALVPLLAPLAPSLWHHVRALRVATAAPAARPMVDR